MSDFLPTYTLLPPGDVTPSHTAVVLHGIWGSRRNWQSYMRRMCERHPDWRFVLVDLRNHGDAPPAPAPHTLSACADDIARLMDHLEMRPDVIMGHSFGGKVAMAFGDQYPDGTDAIWVLDALPGARVGVEAADQGEAVRLIENLRAVPLPLESREALVEALSARGFSQMIAQWMTTNLVRGQHDGAQGFVWRFNIDGIEAMLADYFQHDYWPFLEARAAGFPGPEIKLLRAARSDRWTPEIIARFEEIASEHVSVHLLPDAGHWVHVDNPEGLAILLTEWFDAVGH
ncbi:MAG: alpha/beta fold hydrolase [Bradymonadia bacterium]